MQIAAARVNPLGDICVFVYKPHTFYRRSARDFVRTICVTPALPSDAQHGASVYRLALVIDHNDAFRGDCAFRHLESRRDRAIGKQSFSPTQRNRKYLQPQRIDQIILEERLNEICASIKSGPSCCLVLVIFPAIFPFRNTGGCHSCEVMVFEATYLVAVLTAGQMSLCCGQNRAQRSRFCALSTSQAACSAAFIMAIEETGSECGLIHPPYAKRHWYLPLTRLGLVSRHQGRRIQSH